MWISEIITFIETNFLIVSFGFSRSTSFLCFILRSTWKVEEFPCGLTSELVFHSVLQFYKINKSFATFIHRLDLQCIMDRLLPLNGAKQGIIFSSCWFGVNDMTYYGCYISLSNMHIRGLSMWPQASWIDNGKYEADSSTGRRHIHWHQASVFESGAPLGRGEKVS